MRPRIVTFCAAALVLGITTGTIPAHATSESTPTKESAKSTTTKTATRFAGVPLISDVAGKADVTDPKLVNPWGLAMGKTLWVSNAGTGSATVYSGGAGLITKEKTEVTIPGGTPTGQVFNGGEGFEIHSKGASGPAQFIFASPSGAISGWNAEVDPKNAIISAFTRYADYKGLAMMPTNRGNFLLAADFAHNRIDVFDEDFRRVRMSRSAFRDRALPSSYSAFNVEIVGSAVYIAYAKRDARTGKSIAGKGLGFISRFSATGRFLGRVAARGALNAPWAMIEAPAGFGQYAGALLVGNFGNGWINAWDRRTGRFLGPLRGTNGKPLAWEGLWDLERGTAASGGENAIWFSAGVQKAQHGLVGLIMPSNAANTTPRPSSSPTAPQPKPSSDSNNNSNNDSGY
ncbi:TIGR03118 family protein [Sphaerisporangium sp. TRM90804]|uniref:TIGR03118 family protein n=1 Tax=Sphaerisporangium sp. TRM90804 TaxID=3031113 RepID=UPI002447265A|nr:TIGR03118 family protein [Sphaerisporangium sp. TRM90804]MDH2424025.1 TIGR03118 family protein [Sphaerisporangium sp. TRM90804]